MSKTQGIQSWEQSDFPILCSSCLGPSPALRMTKEKFGHDCKICLKPFTIFRWCPGSGCRFRRTEICQTCARLKNVCQSCIFDLEFGLPVGVRDGVLQIKDKVPQQEVNREYFLSLNANQLAKGEFGRIDYKQIDPASRAILEDLSQRLNGPKTHDLELDTATEVIKKRNLPPVCSFYAKGTCTRGDACPYRHELSAERPASLKSYRERYFGTEDPLAQKLLERLPEAAAAAQDIRARPADKGITAFFVSGIRDGLDEAALRSHFAAFEIKSVTLAGTGAIVDFASRRTAEAASEDSIGLVKIGGVGVRIAWARPRASKPAAVAVLGGAETVPEPDAAETVPEPDAAETIPEPDAAGTPAEPATEEPATKRRTTRAKAARGKK